uniref:DUF4939 domain-containing protein n=1 Tax=Anolis carolinensis TaxID=28377 RepID=A0A803TPI1_ANOCA
MPPVMTHGPCSPVPSTIVADEEENMGISQDEFNRIRDTLQTQEGEIRGLKECGARLPALALPTKFSGEASKVHVFRRQCQAYLEARQAEFPQEDVKVAWIYSLLDGPAATWATALYDAGSTHLSTAQNFLNHLRKTWGIEDEEEAAGHKLRRLFQGDRPLSRYIAEFRVLAQSTGWNDIALRGQFREGLNIEMQEEISKVDPPGTPERLINQCLRAEALLANKKQWKSRSETSRFCQCSATSSMEIPTASPKPHGKRGGADAVGQCAPQTRCCRKGPPPTFESVLVLREWGPLHQRMSSQKEARRPPGGGVLRGAGGGRGGWSKAGGGSQRPGIERLANPVKNPTQEPQTGVLFLLVVTLWSVKKGPVMIHAMIDSGATNNFIDREYADSLGLQYHDFKNARVVQAIDGRPLKTGPVSQWTEPTRMWIREHMEEISFFVTEVPHFPVILGIPWLTLHDPNISWSNRELQFASRYCQNHCLVAKVCHATDAEPIITLPKKYSDFWDVFNEKEAEKLPPHRPYDCAIDLVEGAPIPRGHLYSLTEPEQEALRECHDPGYRAPITIRRGQILSNIFIKEIYKVSKSKCKS